MTLLESLLEYAAMTPAEMRSRHNAIPEVKRLLTAAAEEIAKHTVALETHDLIPKANVIEVKDGDLPPEARRALQDAITTHQAKPLISRQSLGAAMGDQAKDFIKTTMMPYIEDTEGNES